MLSTLTLCWWAKFWASHLPWQKRTNTRFLLDEQPEKQEQRLHMPALPMLPRHFIHSATNSLIPLYYILSSTLTWKRQFFKLKIHLFHISATSLTPPHMKLIPEKQSPLIDRHENGLLLHICMRSSLLPCHSEPFRTMSDPKSSPVSHTEPDLSAASKISHVILDLVI